MIGFTKLSIASYNYDSQGNVEKMIGSHFFTIRYSNTIEKRNILTGKIEQ
jgi:translation initiation factor IF-1